MLIVFTPARRLSGCVAVLALGAMLAGCQSDERITYGGQPNPNQMGIAASTAKGQRVQALLAEFPARVSFFAKVLETGQQFAWRADEPVRTASTIKVPIMVACYRAVAEGKARWEDKIPITPAAKVSGSGVIREFEDGTLLTLRDLMHVMIVVSDNTATNLVLDRLGADYVNDTMQSLGFAQTRSMRKIRGDGSQLKEATGWSQEGQKEENKRFGIGRSTPREMAQLLEMLETGKVVSPEASREMIGVLKRQQYKDGIGRALVDSPGIEVASKSGALDALRSDVGIVYHPKGRVVLAITVDGMETTDYSVDNAGNKFISRLTMALLDHFLAPEPPPVTP